MSQFLGPWLQRSFSARNSPQCEHGKGKTPSWETFTKGKGRKENTILSLDSKPTISK